MKSRALRQSLILFLLALLPAIGQGLYSRDSVSWDSPIAPEHRISLEQAQKKGEAILWIDARRSEEFEREHVPGALPLNEDQWNELLPAVLQTWSPEKTVVVYCGDPGCGASREVSHRLREEAQLTNVFVLEGGWDVLKSGKQTGP